MVLGFIINVATAIIGMGHNFAATASRIVANVSQYFLMAIDTTTSTLDISLVEILLDLCKTVLTLFTIFPLNLFLVSGLIFVAFNIFRSAKKAAK